MPPQIGDFISDSVYDGQLQSNPEHPITSKITACYFVDIEGTEKPSGTSFTVCSLYLDGTMLIISISESY